MKINGHTIEPGQSVRIDAHIAKLPSGTNIDIPIFVSRALREGPTLLIIAGMHGDEINGIETVRRIIHEGLNHPLIGSTICIPVLNIFGFLNFSRDVPDGKDVNRSFPGSDHGSLASLVANFMTHQIIPLIDYGIDFHTGGSRINNYPQIRAVLEDKKNRELAQAFQAPFTLNAPFRDKSLRKQADKYNKKILVYEAGESLRLRKHAIDEAINGCLRIMEYLGMRTESPIAKHKTVILTDSSWVRAHASGLYYTTIRNGSFIHKDEIIGYITDPFNDYKVAVVSHISGYVIGVNNTPVINRGDALLHIGISN